METVKDILASVVGSAACVYTGQPFDTVKVRMQVGGAEWVSPVHCARSTFDKEGLVSLWKGSLPALIGALSENAVAFAVNGALKRILAGDANDSNATSSPLKSFASGGFTGFCTAFVLCPCDVIKCRAQNNRSKGLESTFRDVLFSTIKKGGARALYTGIGIQIIRDIPFYGSFFGSYDLFCAYLKKNTKMSDTSVYFVSGGLAGQVGWVVSIAPDTIKSTIQTSESKLNISYVYRSIYATRGLRGFFTGIEVAIIRAFPANAALFVGYELTRKLLDKEV